MGASVVAKVDRSLQQREAARRLLKFHLKRAQDRMRQQAEKHRTDRKFEVGDLVYLKLQPYRQHTVRRILNQKLSPKCFGPFKVEARVGRVAYRLQLPQGSKVHPTFHVSQLKKHVGAAPVQAELPLVDAHGAWAKEPVKIFEKRMVRRGNRAVTKLLVEWTNSFPEDVTWESFQQMKETLYRSLRTRIYSSRG
ncbi:hypothetical protein J1N35_038348 [Gossypium stocksii]|uniref:Tf2-1-like SH3-like domain-containing protein n=1 Tax=Gossypium stocksii TaxID=47602 RepID=A0A9D3UNN2_9ROSI|nr:hypothetical protein J1N35_038348 [Gossypium stocksii]